MGVAFFIKELCFVCHFGHSLFSSPCVQIQITQDKMQFERSCYFWKEKDVCIGLLEGFAVVILKLYFKVPLLRIALLSFKCHYRTILKSVFNFLQISGLGTQ